MYRSRVRTNTHGKGWPAPASSSQNASVAGARLHRNFFPWIVDLVVFMIPPQWYTCAPGRSAVLSVKLVPYRLTSPCQLETAPPRVALLCVNSSRETPVT